MGFKKVRKSNHRTRGDLQSNIELITENVFVPITKTIFTKKRDARSCNFSKRKVQLVKSCQRTNSVTMPLLKKPCCITMQTHTSAVSYPKQSNATSKCKEAKLTEPTRASLPISKKRISMDDRSENYFQGSENKRKATLSFPSSMSDLPFTLLTKYQPALVDERVNDGNQRKEMRKGDGKVKVRGVGRIVLSDHSKTNGNGKRFHLNKAKSVACRLKDCSFRLTDDDGSSTRVVSSNSISNHPVTLSATAIDAVASKDSVEERCPFDPSSCESALRKIDVIVKGKVSGSVIDHSERLQYPSESICSNTFSQIRCTTFNVATPDRLFETHESDTFKGVRSKLLAKYNFPPSRNHTDRSILSLLRSNDTPPQRNHRYHPCSIKYSWQVIGTSSQTSQTLLESFIKENSFLDETIYDCSIKYSWQIIGIATQTSPTDFNADQPSSLISFLSGKTNATRRDMKGAVTADPLITTVWRRGKRFIVLNNQWTQTFAHKESQTVFAELHERYIR